MRFGARASRCARSAHAPRARKNRPPLLLPPGRLQDPACANVADWFQAFAEVHLQESVAGGSRASKKGQRGGAKARGGGGGGGASRGSAAPVAVDGERARRLRELAARFTQATCELQLVGLIKPAKRRRGDYVQRCVHMPAAD